MTTLPLVRNTSAMRMGDVPNSTSTNISLLNMATAANIRTINPLNTITLLLQTPHTVAIRVILNSITQTAIRVTLGNTSQAATRVTLGNIINQVAQHKNINRTSGRGITLDTEWRQG